MNLGLAVDVEKKDGTRTLMVPVIRDAGRLPFDRFVAAYDALVEKARTNTLTADDLQGREHHAHQPGRPRHGRLGAAADGGPGHDRGDRLDRLSAWASATIGAMIGAEKVMTMTSTYDHRIIQGAESGRFLARIEEYLQGERGFYDERVRLAGRRARPGPAPPAPAAAAAAAAASGRDRRRDGARAERGAAAGGAGGEHAA